MLRPPPAMGCARAASYPGTKQCWPSTKADAPVLVSSSRAAATIGSSCPKSGESMSTSPATTICSSVVTAWAL
jgi:hypothetical protein